MGEDYFVPDLAEESLQPLSHFSKYRSLVLPLLITVTAISDDSALSAADVTEKTASLAVLVW